MKKKFIDHKSSTNKAIKKINSLGGQSLIVVQNKNIFKGILSSFDLRKAIMNKNILNKDISKIYNKKAKTIFSDELEDKFSEIQTSVRRLRVIPVIDRKTNKVINIINLKNLTSQKFKKKKIDCSPSISMNANIFINGFSKISYIFVNFSNLRFLFKILYNR